MDTERRQVEKESLVLLLKEIQQDVHQLKELSPVHQEHHQYISELIEKEKQKISLRKSIIEKTLTSLIWSAIIFVSVAVWSYIKEHLK